MPQGTPADDRYEDILNQMIEGCQIVDPDWRYRYLNETAARHARRERNELLGRKMTDLFPGIEQTPMFQILSACMRDRTPGRMAHEFVYPNGASAWFALRFQPVAAGMLILSLDITESKRAAETRTRLAAIVESSDDAIIGKTLDGIITSWNPGAESLFGYAEKEAVGKPMLLFFPPERRDEEREILDRIARGERVRHFDTVRLHRSGRPVDVSVTISPIRNDLGQIVGASTIARDITDRKEAEAALREREERLQRAEAVAHLGHWRIDLRTGETSWSEGMYRIFGVSHKTFQPSVENYMARIHPEDRDLVARTGEEMRQNGAGQSTFRLLRPDGTLRYVTRQGEILRDASGGDLALFGTLQDTTELRLRERELQEKNAELERFTYTISHDLRSPLVTIKTFLGYLDKDMKQARADRIEKDLFFMGTAADKMGHLLEELLEMSRLGRIANTPEEVTYREVVSTALHLMAGAIAEKGVTVLLQEASLTLFGDRSRLVEIWQNLVENAIKFMGDQIAPRIEIGTKRRDQERVFFVSDNGRGIDPRFQEKVFGLFEKLEAQSEGTGLGLALIKRIIELYQGRIWVDSAGTGRGTCFYFTLPNAVRENTE